MSKKPPKKSDLNKGWMRARRDVPKKIAPEYHLIVTEGTDKERRVLQKQERYVSDLISVYGRCNCECKKVG